MEKPTLIEAISDILHGGPLQHICNKRGADIHAAQKAVSAGVPALLAAILERSDTAPEATAFLRVLEPYTGEYLNDPMVYLGDTATDTDVAGREGLARLHQILGDQRDRILVQLAKASGLSQDTTDRVLGATTTMLLHYIGREVKQNAFTNADLIAYLKAEQSHIRNSAPGLVGFLERIDANDDGNVLDDLGRLVGRLFRKN
jgi:hypothetical protein